MENIAKTMLLFGALLLISGGLLLLLSRFNLPLGRLPGDIRIEGQNGSFYFPITSAILVSVVLSLLLNLINRFWGK